jgi:hypothetical protein
MRSKVICFISFVLVLSIAGSASADLVAHWKLNEGSGNTAYDSSPSGNDGTLVGDPQWVAGYYGAALAFEGAGDNIDFGNDPSLNITDEITLSAWINMAQRPATDTWYTIEWKEGAYSMYLYGVSDTLTTLAADFLLDTGAADIWSGPEIDIRTNEWTHIAVTFNSTDFDFYVTGVHDFTHNQPGAIARSSINLLFTENGSNLAGLIFDDVRIYNNTLTQDAIRVAMKGSPGLASDPAPGDKETGVGLDKVLSWIPGAFASTHDVYLGTSFDDVNDASADNPMGVLISQGQTENASDPGRLPFGEMYYWRVDDVNGAPDFTVFRGDIWSFTVEAFSTPIANITVTADSAPGTSVAEKTIDGSGMTGDLHGATAGDMWISAGIPATIEYAFDGTYKLHELWIWNSNQVIESFLGFGAKDVVIEHSLDGENWTVLDGVGPLAQAPGALGYAHNNTIDFAGAIAQHVRMTINSVYGFAPQASLSEVRFYAIPTRAARPNPATGATNVAPDAPLSWGKNGRDADHHEVFVGSDPENLSSAGTVNENSLNTLTLDLQLSQTYHWRVDEINDVMDPSTWQGAGWSFTTAGIISIDDMERYKDQEFLEIWATWVDGFEDLANGSLVGGASGTPETGIVHGGSQSLPMDYDNGTAARSEAMRTFDAPMDWTGHGVQSLVVHFQGSPDNTGGKLYVKINDTRVDYDGDASHLMGSEWREWTITLADLAGDLSRVNSLTIGVDGGGAGVVYVDDIFLRGGTR